MSYWDYEEPMWEPSEADELFDELKSKLVDAAKASLKNDMESLKSRNEYLEKRNKELEDKAQEVSRKESVLEYKAQNLRREVEREFYKTAIDDLFKDAIEQSQLWFADNKPHEKPKCDKCNADRKWVLTWPDGTTTSKQCTCSQPDYWYEPEETWIDVLKYKVKDSNYPSERYYRLDESYQSTGSNSYDYSFVDFGIQFVYDKFCDDAIEKREQLNYGKYIGFTSKEECQKYCDWLNKRKNKENER
jgi:hypothetical protein|nr:MAG TPA_asm: ribonuclease Y [Caudoviricetes sp.]